KFKYLRSLIVRGVCQKQNLPARAVQGGANRKLLILARAAGTLAVRCRIDSHERPARPADWGGFVPVCKPCAWCLHSHGLLSGKSVATRLTSAATAASASSPDALISIMLSRA